MRRSDENLARVAKGAVIGAAGGLAGALAMNLFHSLWSRVSSMLEAGAESSGGGEPATVKAARRAAHAFGRELPSGRKETASNAVHYAMGAAMGAIVGAADELSPALRRTGGLLPGAGVWLVADETLVPALGLSKPPWTFGAETHLRSLGAHLVFGTTVEAVRRVLSRWWR